MLRPDALGGELTVALSRSSMLKSMMLPSTFLIIGLGYLAFWFGFLWSLSDGIPALEFWPVALAWVSPLLLVGGFFVWLGGWVLLRKWQAMRDPRFDRWRMVIGPDTLQLFPDGPDAPARLTLHWSEVEAIHSGDAYVRNKADGLFAPTSLVFRVGPGKRRWKLARIYQRFKADASVFAPLESGGLVCVSIAAVDTGKKDLLNTLRAVRDQAPRQATI